jgi:translation initiation factor 1 (eIF-1/SUI1)
LPWLRDKYPQFVKGAAEVSALSAKMKALKLKDAAAAAAAGGGGGAAGQAAGDDAERQAKDKGKGGAAGKGGKAKEEAKAEEEDEEEDEEEEDDAGDGDEAAPKKKATKTVAFTETKKDEVLVKLVSRNKRKSITVVTGLENFGECGRARACASVCVSAAPAHDVAAPPPLRARRPGPEELRQELFEKVRVHLVGGEGDVRAGNPDPGRRELRRGRLHLPDVVRRAQGPRVQDGQEQPAGARCV